MADRVSTISLLYTSDLSAAKREYDEFLAYVDSHPPKVGAGFSGDTRTQTTFGGLMVQTRSDPFARSYEPPDLTAARFSALAKSYAADVEAAAKATERIILGAPSAMRSGYYPQPSYGFAAQSVPTATSRAHEEQRRQEASYLSGLSGIHAQEVASARQITDASRSADERYLSTKVRARDRQAYAIEQLASADEASAKEQRQLPSPAMISTVALAQQAGAYPPSAPIPVQVRRVLPGPIQSPATYPLATAGGGGAQPPATIPGPAMGPWQGPQPNLGALATMTPAQPLRLPQGFQTNFRLSGFGRLATAGFAVRELLGAANDEAKYREALTLAGNDQRATLDATLAERDRLFNFPIVGQAFGIYGRVAEIPTRATLKASDVQDEAIEATKQYTLYSQQLGRTAEAYAAGPGYERDRRISINEFTEQRQQTLKLRDAEISKQRESIMADALASVSWMGAKQLVHYLPPDDSAPDAERMQSARNAAAFDIAAPAIQEMSKRITARYALTTNAQDIILNENVGATNRDEERYRRTTQAQNLQLRGFDLGASLANVRGEFTPVFDSTGRMIALAGISRAANPIEFQEKLDRYNVAATAAKTDFQRSTTLERGDIGATLAAITATPRFRDFAREMSTIQTRGEAERIGVSPLSPRYWLSVARQGADMAATYQQQQQEEARHQIAGQTTIDVLTAALQRDPLKATLARIEGERQSSLVGIPITDTAERNRINRTAGLQGSIARQQYGDESERIGLGLDTERSVLTAQLARDTAGAQVQGILGEGEQRSLLLHQQGRDFEAASSLGNTQLALQNFAQNYGDSFRLSEISRHDTYLGNPKDVENPAAVMKEVADAIAKVQTEQTTRIIDALRALVRD